MANIHPAQITRCSLIHCRKQLVKLIRKWQWLMVASVETEQRKTWHLNLQCERTSVNILSVVQARKQVHPHLLDRLINHSLCLCCSGMPAPVLSAQLDAKNCTAQWSSGASSWAWNQSVDAAMQEVIGLLACMRCEWNRIPWQVWFGA